MINNKSINIDRDSYNSHVLSKSIKAGRRTYFFDVKATRGDDYFITITESRKCTSDEGSVTYDRHKIFLYKEDFEKFVSGLSEAIAFVKKTKSEYFDSSARGVDFDDL